MSSHFKVGETVYVRRYSGAFIIRELQTNRARVVAAGDPDGPVGGVGYTDLRREPWPADAGGGPVQETPFTAELEQPKATIPADAIPGNAHPTPAPDPTFVKIEEERLKKSAPPDAGDAGSEPES